MQTTDRPFSDLLRNPKEVTREVDTADVVLRRRNEPDLRLTLADRDADRVAAFTAMGRTLRNLALRNPEVLQDALGDAFPWLELLPEPDRETFADEFSRVVVATADLDNFVPLGQLVREWRATADVHADPSLARNLRRPLDATGARVEPPMG
jgi:hypothetical protein